MAKIYGDFSGVSGGFGDNYVGRQTKKGAVLAKRPRKTSTPRRSEKQMGVRGQLGNVAANHRLYEGKQSMAFEGKPASCNEFNMMVQANYGVTPVYLSKQERLNGGCVVAPYQYCRGSLRSINAEVNDGGVLVSDIALGSLQMGATTKVSDLAAAVLNNNTGWEDMDQITFFYAKQYIDTVTLVPRATMDAWKVVLDVNDERRVTARANVGEVFRLRLLNIVAGRAVLAGFIRTPKSPKGSDCFDKMVGMALDLETEGLRTDVVSFTSDELNVFGNMSTKKENSVGMVDNLVIAGRAATSFGGSLLLEREWKITTHSTKTPDQHDYYTMGALAFAVDTNGKIVWHKPFRSVCHEMTGQSWDLSCYLDAPMRAMGDDVFVFLSESPKTPLTYDISQPAKTSKLQTQKHATCIYGISKEGEVAKKVFELEDKATLVDVWKSLSEKKFVSLCIYKKKSALVYVNF
jgi:hypothetical protein